MNNKKIIFSGIQPTGRFTLGNYLGAISNWKQMQDDYDCMFSLVDLHALTVRQDPEALRRETMTALATLLACGIEPSKSLVFIQSHVQCHAELCWVLNCYSMLGQLQRMTQFKDKSGKNEDNLNAGLLTYPVLMAADILLYDTDLVPVGADQKQHLEFARDVAIRFNSVHGDVFKIPEPYISKIGAKINSLADPLSKMSKSDKNPKATIFLLDDRDAIMKKFKSAVTDSESIVSYREGKDGVNNLMTIYGRIMNKTHEETEREFEGIGYGGFKTAVGEAVADALSPISREFDRLIADTPYLAKVYRDGAEAALLRAQVVMRRVYDKIGLIV